ncbi:Protein argonaute 4B [Arachis hypogaea]|nr:Protein argonaute 4B [Arachis hypogaea]
MSHGFVSLNADLVRSTIRFSKLSSALVEAVSSPSLGRFLGYVSTTMVVKPGPVLDFLCENQNVKHPDFIDWTKAKSVLKNLRIKVNNLEFKISGLSDNTCRTQKDKKLG